MVEVGIIGLGDAGMCNAAVLRALGEDVVAFSDKDETALERARQIFEPNVKALTDITEFMKQPGINLVVVATPDSNHLEPSELALQAGKYVFVEKPVATSIRELIRFKELSIVYPNRIIFGEKYSFARPVQAALAQRRVLGDFIGGSTSYMMENSARIMGAGKWRTQSAYNPCAGGLSHNFMVNLLFSESPISRVRATAQVMTYHELDQLGGADTMEGTLEFASGKYLSWIVALGIRGTNSPFGHRTVIHNLLFENGALAYGTEPEGDKLIVNGERAVFNPEPSAKEWPRYNLDELYIGMHQDTLKFIRGEQTLHNISQGVNVAAACVLAHESARQGGTWIDLPSELVS